MHIGEKIRALRRARKLTQEQLAEYLQLSAQAISKWETGLASPDIDMLPRLAVFFHTTPDELLSFDQSRIDEEVQALVRESVPLRSEPEKAEAFYREALRRYPNNETLLNCLLMVIPNSRAKEKLAIGERLLDCTEDMEIRCDVLRLLAQCCHAAGEDVLARQYLRRLPELYFLKNELAAAITCGDEQLDEIRKTERVCLGILQTMLALREERADEAERGELRALSDGLLALYGRFPEHEETLGRLRAARDRGELLAFYQ